MNVLEKFDELRRILQEYVYELGRIHNVSAQYSFYFKKIYVLFCLPNNSYNLKNNLITI